MRIAIDLQGAQGENRQQAAGRSALELALGLARNRGAHELLVVLNDRFPDSIAELRAAFDGLLPPDAIRVWTAPGPTAWRAPGSAEGRRQVELIREAFLASLEPDVVLVASLFEGLNGDTSTSIGRLVHLPTAVVVHELLPPGKSERYLADPSSDAWYVEKLDHLRRADHLLAMSKEAAEAVRSGLGWEPQRLTDLTPAASSDRDTSAVRTLQALEDAFASRAVSPPVGVGKQKPRLAFLSPLPPQRSGISDYSADLLPALSRHYEIEVIAHQETVSDAWITANLPVRDVDWFRRNADSFDRVLYHFGNSEFHVHMVELLEEIPGAIVLHDFFLSGLFFNFFPNDWPELLLENHGYQAFFVEYWDRIIRFPANVAVLRNARGVIVHSEYSRQLADSWHGPGAAAQWTVVPLLRIPAADREIDRQAARRALGIDEETLLVCSYGFLNPIKLNDRILDAFLASSLVHDPNVRLIFVGYAEENDFCHDIAAKIAAYNLAHRIIITGWTSKEDFERYLGAADIAVQLRRDSRGETSAAVMDCMNHGLATIVNANGSMAELDRKAVRILPDAFDDQELIAALEELAGDAGLRRRMGSRASRIIHERHSPTACAQGYYDAIERAYDSTASAFRTLPDLFVADCGPVDEHATALALARNFPPFPRRRQLLVDISRLDAAAREFREAARATLAELLRMPPEGWLVEPIVESGDGGFDYARAFTARLLGIDLPPGRDVPAEAWQGDLYVSFGPDAPTAQLDDWQRRGVEVLRLAADPAAASLRARLSDQGISRSVRSDSPTR